ncbi:hypothetical protein [Pseudolactococcus laudensis]|uniref:hypothetical protein n=1 Tax=Pseudolactococcus laudensis TaxID=1494461 RepID=UPI002FC80D74
MALNLNYGERKIFWGNEGLLVAKLDATGVKPVAKNIKLVTGLVSVGEMEDQAETSNFAADDISDHGSKKGATLLQGEMVFMQLDQGVAEDLMGQVKSENGLGYISTGNYSDFIVQYVNKARKKTADGGVDGYKINVYPSLKATADAVGESETDSSDGVDPIQYTLPVSATGTAAYRSQGKTPAVVPYEVWGEQAIEFEKMMNDTPFIMFPDTVIPAKALGK